MSAKRWLVIAALASALLACASNGAPRQPTASGLSLPSSQRQGDGPVFVGTAPEVPGSSGRLVLERNFQQTRMLRWQSRDSRIGPAQVDFFEPREWKFVGDPPERVSFRDRSPGPILFGEVELAPGGSAVVYVVLGNDRVRYTLKRLKRLERQGQEEGR